MLTDQSENRLARLVGLPSKKPPIIEENSHGVIQRRCSIREGPPPRGRAQVDSVSPNSAWMQGQSR